MSIRGNIQQLGVRSRELSAKAEDIPRLIGRSTGKLDIILAANMLGVDQELTWESR